MPNSSVGYSCLACSRDLKMSMDLSPNMEFQQGKWEECVESLQ